jgi:two-component system cell cycle sensor histidine kinase/response regulator CckA
MILEVQEDRGMVTSDLSSSASDIRFPGQDSAAFLAAIIESSDDAIISKRLDGTITSWNSGAQAVYGYAPDEVLGKNISLIVPADRRDELAEVLARIGMGTHIERHETQRVRKDGTVIDISITISPIFDPTGHVIGASAIGQDISYSRSLERGHTLLEDRLRQSERLESLGKLAGGIAHDFNNILGVILNYSILAGKHVTEPRAVADLGEIRAAAERGAGLTRQLLTFARRIDTVSEPLDVNGVVRSIASMLSRTLGAHLDLRLELAEHPVVTIIDRHQLEQIVLNLVINARDAMPHGGQLTIRTALAPFDAIVDVNLPTSVPMVTLQVIDTGHGMPPDVMARAFEPFFTTKAQGEGTGLGLATVYGVVRRYLGDVTIDTSEGSGTTVTVTLRGTRQVPAADAAPKADLIGGTERILLVEDEFDLRATTERILAEWGYEVVVASNGIEALELWQRESGRFDLVLTDVVMPEMAGDQLAERLAELDENVKVIFMSGYNSGELPDRGRILPKPVDEDELLYALREAFDS